MVVTIEALADRVWAFAEQVDSCETACLTSLAGLLVFCRSEPTLLECTLYRPSVCLILQGRKESYLGSRQMSYAAGESVIVSHDLPVVARVVEASRARPYLALVMEIDVTLVRSLYDELGEAEIEQERARALDVGETDEALIDAMARLFDLNERPLEAKVMAPLIKREIHFRLLLVRHGAMLRQLLRHDSHASRIARAISRIRQDYAMPLAITDLAGVAGMSPSSFHEHFKSVTNTTPLQYQKDLRLLEARRLLIGGQYSVSAAAFEVGYESPTQFSREYSRKFGTTPRADLIAISAA
jgi:AraC-like DNA-binding protein